MLFYYGNPFLFRYSHVKETTSYCSGHALEIWICGCSLFYKRELWASKSAGAHSTKSLQISGCKSWCPKDLRVCAPTAPVLTHSLLLTPPTRFLLLPPSLYSPSVQKKIPCLFIRWFTFGITSCIIPCKKSITQNGDPILCQFLCFFFINSNDIRWSQQIVLMIIFVTILAELW
jgi:hypothetical protein